MDISCLFGIYINDLPDVNCNWFGYSTKEIFGSAFGIFIKFYAVNGFSQAWNHHYTALREMVLCLILSTATSCYQEEIISHIESLKY